MADWSSSNITLTALGASALSKVQSGDGSLTITRVVASEQYVAESTLREVTSLSVENLELIIVDRHEVQDGGSVIQVQLNNANLDAKFTLNEIGVYATHSSAPTTEFLYIIAQVDADTGDKIPLYSTTPVTATYDIYLYNVGADNVNVTVSSAGLVTYESLNTLCHFILRNTEYKTGDITYSSRIPSWAFLRALEGGTTANNYLSFPTTFEAGDTFVDGTVTWKVCRLGEGTSAWEYDAEDTSLHPKDVEDLDTEGVGVDATTLGQLINTIVDGKIERVPVGTVVPFSGNGAIPSGYLLCNGAAVSRTMYPDLFTAIGTTYGAGDGSTTFNLPDLTDKFIEGAEGAGTEKEAGLPNIEGVIVSNVGDSTGGFRSTSGAFYGDGVRAKYLAEESGAHPSYATVVLDASRSSAIYGNSLTVQPSALTMRYVIKAFNGQTNASALIDITQFAQELANATRGLRYRQASTAYNVGDIANHPDLPTGWYLESTTNGLTDSNTLTISNPAIGGTVSDGTVTWIINENFKYHATSDNELPDNLMKTGAYNYQSDDITGRHNSGIMCNFYRDSVGRLFQLALQTGGTGADNTYERNVIYSRVHTNDASPQWSPWLQQEAIVAKSLGTNGYVKYASGLIIQWGTVSTGFVTDSSGLGYKCAFAFPVAFTTHFNISVIGGGGTPYTNERNYYLANNTLSNAQFNTSFNGPFSYIAIGY